MSIQRKTVCWVLMFLLNSLFVSSVLAFNASVNSSYTYDSNVFKSKENKSSDFIMIVSPKLSTEFPYKNFKIGGAYSTDYGRYVERPTQDYLTQNLAFSFDSGSRSRFALKAGYAYKSAFDVRGESDSNPTSTETPDVWVSHSQDAALKYRNAERTSSYEISYGYTKKLFGLEESEIKNFDSLLLKFTNDYKLSGRSRAYYSIDRQTIKYMSSSDAQFDSSEMGYLVGVDWVSSGKTESLIEFGWKTKINEAGGDQVFSGLVTNIKLNWAHKSYSRYKLILSRSTKTSPSNNATNLVTNIFSLGWTHQFTRKLSTSLKWDNSYNQYNTGQSDLLSAISPSLMVNVTRWFSITPNFKWNMKKSSMPNLEYDSYVISVLFNLKYLR